MADNQAAVVTSRTAPEQSRQRLRHAKATGRGKPDSALEELRIRFRRFSSSEEPDPIKALRRLRDLCGL